MNYENPVDVLDQMIWHTIRSPQAKNTIETINYFWLLSQIGLIHQEFIDRFLWRAIPFDFPLGLFSPNIYQETLESYIDGELYYMGQPSEVVQCPYISIELLEKMAQSDDEQGRASIAKNPKVPVQLLIQLAEDSSVSVRIEVAKSLNSPVGLLALLAEDNSMEVRCAVAKNVETPVKVLIQLVQDQNQEVCRHVGENPNLPVELLEEWVTDEGSRICYGIPFYPNTPIEIAIQEYQHRVTEYDDCYDYRKWLASHPQTPQLLLEWLGKPNHWKAWANLVTNPRTPVVALEKMLSHHYLYDLALNSDVHVHLTAANLYLTQKPGGLPFVLEKFAQISPFLLERFLAYTHSQLPPHTIVQSLQILE